MSWEHLYLVIGIAALLVSVWRLARGAHLLLPLAGILWFLVVLFRFFVPEAYRLALIRGVPSLGRLIHYVAVPVLLVLLLLSVRGRRA
jgi:hypothetical protein